jgi:hypothetical protein
MSRGFARCLLEGSVLPFFKDLISHLCDRPSSLSKQVLKAVFFFVSCNKVAAISLIVTPRNSGYRPLQPLSSRSSSSLALHLYRHCGSSGSSSQGGCCRRFYRGVSHAATRPCILPPPRHLSPTFPSFSQLSQYPIDLHRALPFSPLIAAISRRKSYNLAGTPKPTATPSNESGRHRLTHVLRYRCAFGRVATCLSGNHLNGFECVLQPLTWR